MYHNPENRDLITQTAQILLARKTQLEHMALDKNLNTEEQFAIDRLKFVLRALLVFQAIPDNITPKNHEHLQNIDSTQLVIELCKMLGNQTLLSIFLSPIPSTEFVKQFQERGYSTQPSRTSS